MLWDIFVSYLKYNSVSLGDDVVAFLARILAIFPESRLILPASIEDSESG